MRVSRDARSGSQSDLLYLRKERTPITGSGAGGVPAATGSLRELPESPAENALPGRKKPW
jgi:hypothetical protein